MLNYELTGARETIIFIHGDTLDHRMWWPQVQYLQSHFQILTYDMPGFGQSTAINHPFYQHEVLKDLISQLKLPKVNLVGSSYGGEIAVNFTLTYPDLVNSLILLDTSLGGFPCTVDWNVHIEDGLEATKRNWLNHEVFGSIRKNPEVNQLLKEIVADYQGTDWFHPECRQKFNPSALSRLAEITQPILAVTGEGDLPYFQAISNQFTHAKRVIIPGASHLPNLEQPTEVNRLLESFLKSS